MPADVPSDVVPMLGAGLAACQPWASWGARPSARCSTARLEQAASGRHASCSLPGRARHRQDRSRRPRLAVVLHAGGTTVVFGRCDEDGAVPYRVVGRSPRPPRHAHRATRRWSPSGGASSPTSPGSCPPSPDRDSGRARAAYHRPRRRPVVAVHRGHRVARSRIDGHAGRARARRPAMGRQADPAAVATRRRRGDTPLLVMGTYRDSEPASDHPLTDVLAALRRELRPSASRCGDSPTLRGCRARGVAHEPGAGPTRASSCTPSTAGATATRSSRPAAAAPRGDRRGLPRRRGSLGAARRSRRGGAPREREGGDGPAVSPGSVRTAFTSCRSAP